MYQLQDFVKLGLYEEKPVGEECEIGSGQVIANPKVSHKIKNLLDTKGGSAYEGDYSRQDSAVITSLLSAGYSPSDVYYTFLNSTRGRHASQRKSGHIEDYVRRTIQKALGFLNTIDKTPSGRIDIDFSRRRRASDQAGLVVLQASNIEVERVQWIWPPYIPAGKLTIIAGDPGMGKSTITIDLISRISKGTFLPSGNRTITGSSLIASAEDAPEDTITPRLIAAEANIQRIGIIKEVRDEAMEDETKYLSLPRDLRLLRDYLKKHGSRILIIDPLNAFLDRGTDTYKDQDMRSVLHPLEEIAQETGTAIIVVAHLTKKEDVSTLYRVGGSIGFIAAARSVLSVGTMENGTKVLYSLKANLSAKPPSLAYETRQVTKQRTNGQWLGEKTIYSTTIRWLGEVEFNPMSKTPSTVPAAKVNAEATEFLQQVLQDAGEMMVDDIYREAKAAGIIKSTLHKVRAIIGVKAVKKSGRWHWQWPEE